MTTSDEGTSGPPSSPTGSAGFSHVYRAGDWITCPGYGLFDRRREGRGEDRRKLARPCTYTFGRVQLGTVAWVKIVNRGDAIGAGTTLGCPACRATVLLYLTAASEAA